MSIFQNIDTDRIRLRSNMQITGISKEPDNNIKQKTLNYSLHNVSRDPHISAAQLI